MQIRNSDFPLTLLTACLYVVSELFQMEARSGIFLHTGYFSKLLLHRDPLSTTAEKSFIAGCRGKSWMTAEKKRWSGPTENMKMSEEVLW